MHVRVREIPGYRCRWAALTRAYARTHLGAQPLRSPKDFSFDASRLKASASYLLLCTTPRIVSHDGLYTMNCQRQSRVLSWQSIAECYQTLHLSRSERFGSARPSARPTSVPLDRRSVDLGRARLSARCATAHTWVTSRDVEAALRQTSEGGTHVGWCAIYTCL